MRFLFCIIYLPDFWSGSLWLYNSALRKGHRGHSNSGFYLDREGATIYPRDVRKVTLAEFDSECKQIK